MSRTNYIFIDYENVQETNLDRLAGKPVKVVLVLGARHKNLPVKLVKLIHKFSEQMRLIETGLNGKNALDFVLACEIGLESEKDPRGYFHILSRDKGFDALIKHLKGKKLLAARHAAFSEIPVLMNREERVKFIIERFKSDQVSRAVKRKTLELQIQALFGKTLSPDELDDTIKGLIAAKFIALSEKGEVEYKVIAAAVPTQPASTTAPKLRPLKTAAELDVSLPALVDRAFKKKL